jgi:hypothetical protein
MSPAAPPPPNLHGMPMAQNFMPQPMMYTDGYNTFQNGQFVQPQQQYNTFDYSQQPGFMPAYPPPPPVLNQPIPPGTPYSGNLFFEFY